jgi:hypothetical protein
VLDDNGLLGWHQGLLSVRRAITDAGWDDDRLQSVRGEPLRCEHRDLAELARWLETESRSEELRWRTPATVVRSFRLVVQAGAHTHPHVMARWTANLRAAAVRQSAFGPASRQLQRHLDVVEARLPNGDDGQRCRQAIAELRWVLSAPTDEPRWLPLAEPSLRYGLRRWLQPVVQRATTELDAAEEERSGRVTPAGTPA